MAHILDLDCPGWATLNEDGLWCDVCGEILIAAFHLDDTTTVPECCRTCGAPDDIDAMAEYFA